MKKACTTLLTASLFSLCCFTPALAHDIKISNNTDIPIKKLECFSEYSTTPDSVILQNLPAQSSTSVHNSHMPDQMCSRLVFTLADGKVMQFYAEHEVGSLDSFSFELSPISKYHTEKTDPSILCYAGDTLYQHIPGLSLDLARQFFQAGTSTADWEAWTTPYAKLGDFKNNFLETDSLSWNLIDMKKNDDVPVSMSFSAPLVTNTIMPTFEAIAQAQFTLQKVILDGKEKPLTEDEKKDPATLVVACVESKNSQMIFQHGAVVLTLSFPGDDTLTLMLAKK